ncbi:MAG: amphi-Trp domain-containing protein [Halobacteriales archaeon]|jgi:amphi-Trp domain-containing protein
MPEEVLFEVERSQDRAEIADMLRSVADKLDGNEAITLTAGEQSITLDPPARPTFEIKAERETPSGGGPGELSVEFEIEWDENGDSGGQVDIE